MPPYSSSLDGSFRIQSAKNSAKHGTGSAFIENSVDLFGSSHQYVKSSNDAADLSVQSAKNLNLTSAATSHLTGQNVNLTSASDSTIKSTAGSMVLEAIGDDGSCGQARAACCRWRHSLVLLVKPLGVKMIMFYKDIGIWGRKASHKIDHGKLN